MNGALRDPHVGHDVLVGVVAGTLFALCLKSRGLIAALAGDAVLDPVVTSFAPLIGVHKTVGNLANGLPNAIGNGMLLILAFAFLRMLLGRTWLAAAVLWVIISGLVALGVGSGAGKWIELAMIVAGVAMMLGVAVRFGLLATIVMFFVWVVFEATPLTADASQRYFATSMWILGGVLALAAAAAYAARAGQPLFGTDG
jgi:hypothetical protein